MLAGPRTDMTTAYPENLTRVTERHHRSAHMLPILPPAVENTPKTDQNVSQEAGTVAENDGQVGLGAIILRKTVGDGHRPKANGEIPAQAAITFLSVALIVLM